MKKAHKVRVGISIGDLNGIGSEVILKTFADQRMLDFCTPVIFANNKLLSFYKKHFKMNINFQGVDDAQKIIDGKFNVVNIWKDNLKINFGEEDKFLGKFTLQSLEASTQALKNGDIDTLVTAPINKNVIQSDKFNFPGHTDYLAKHLGGGESLMFMISQNLKVGLLTDHVAVKEVSEVITPSLIEKKVNMISNSLKADFKVRKPKIAILGINPHSGDNGVIGKEDEEVLKPTIKKLQDKGNLVYGPYAADSFFGTKNYQNFDAVVAAYHDQGLIPFKTLSFGNGVNFTAGLEKVRTSPDHGTAYEIAGKGEADYTSFKEAVFASIEIFKNRKEYEKLTKNPLKKQNKKL
ncbi:4-hydroxythreonine-4-phosphate dehydrogenase PdxA [Mesonia sp. K4-1]|uniref:4-hydroxythreonine-4-phosphate dehydrogenase PdxA n=1 Tax=Mesonia sp. K4-1 TaxID=2602760 RepID=UPI0011C834C5|nr:4-hydroxythreonine-4-phosphate dehydrogenase PdxA [Mesonia sp. K4-1]TXK78573.1 4-hydroxythreonine-4-phosphate dehydrogenase PdxA [Mesonia sp. K4-1]